MEFLKNKKRLFVIIGAIVLATALAVILILVLSNRRTIRLVTLEGTCTVERDGKTLEGSVSVKMPPGIQDGQKLRLRGKGLPKRDGTNGDLYVRIRVELPRHLNSKQNELWQELAKLG